MTRQQTVDRIANEVGMRSIDRRTMHEATGDTADYAITNGHCYALWSMRGKVKARLVIKKVHALLPNVTLGHAGDPSHVLFLHVANYCVAAVMGPRPHFVSEQERREAEVLRGRNALLRLERSSADVRYLLETLN